MYINILILRSNSVDSVKLLSNQIIYLVRNYYRESNIRVLQPGINCNAIQTRNFSLDEILVGNGIPFFAVRKNPLGVKFISPRILGYYGQRRSLKIYTSY